MELFSPGHLIPLLIIAGFVFFGWKQLPDMSRSVGRSLRIFKNEMAPTDPTTGTGGETLAASPAEAPTPPAAEIVAGPGPIGIQRSDQP